MEKITSSKPFYCSMVLPKFPFCQTYVAPGIYDSMTIERQPSVCSAECKLCDKQTRDFHDHSVGLSDSG